MANQSYLDPQAVTDMLAAVGTDRFGSTLLEAAQRAGPVSEVFIFRWTETALPCLITVAGKRDGSSHRAAIYVDRYFHHDPMLFQHRGTSQGTGFSQTYRVGSIAPQEYQQRCFVEPGFAEKHSFGWKWPQELLIANFYTEAAGSVSLQVLELYASVALAAAHGFEMKRSTSISTEWIESNLKALFPELSARERLVCVQTILGNDSLAIAEANGIARSSVLTYRRRAYQKMGVSSAAQALDRMMSDRTA